MKTQNLSYEDWFAWNGKTSDTGRFAPVPLKKSHLTTSQTLIKKSELEKMRAACASEKATKDAAPETTSNTQRIDICFDSLWRKCT